MELFPDLEFRLLNGWIFLGFHVLVQGFLMFSFPKDVNVRLLDRSDWSVMQKISLVTGKVFSLACPISFFLGILIYTGGLIGLVVSMLNFRNTPQDSLAQSGLYKISRHPQIVSLFFLFTGMSLVIGSWIALFTLLMSRILQHYSILAEEEACINQFGDSYRSYMKQVPRYLLFL
jgi:protein-S-isoprenylcysteine O-methyltransferase Ste14